VAFCSDCGCRNSTENRQILCELRLTQLGQKLKNGQRTSDLRLLQLEKKGKGVILSQIDFGLSCGAD